MTVGEAISIGDDADGKILIPRASGALGAGACRRFGCGSGARPLDALSSYLPRPTDYPIPRHRREFEFQGDITGTRSPTAASKFAWIKGRRRRRQRRRALPGRIGTARKRLEGAVWKTSFRLTPAGRRWRRWANLASRCCEGELVVRGLDVEVDRRRRPAIAIAPSKTPSPRMKVMLDEMQRHYGKRPIIYNDRLLLPGDPR